MSLLEGLRSRAGKIALSLSAAPPAPVSLRAAAPLASKLGILALRRGVAGPTAEPPPSDWSLNPETGATLPTGANVQVGPWDHAAARKALRHGWFAAHAWQVGASRDDAGHTEVIDALQSWLRQDLPGQGLGWAHPTDLAVRMLHWHAALSWVGPIPDALREAMAGSAFWHIQHLIARMPRGERDVLRRVVHHAGLVIAGLTFPDLPNARQAWSVGLAGLKHDLPNLFFDDGSPRDAAPLVLADALWQVAVARAVAIANGIGFPSDADVALARGARFLERLGGGIPDLPGVGEAPVAAVLTNDESVGAALWDACLTWNIETGEAAAVPSPARLAWLGLSLPTARPEAPKAWSRRVWREGGIAVAEHRIKNRPSRASAWFGTVGRRSPLSHPVPLHLLWDVGDLSVLADPGPGFDSPGQEAETSAVATHSCLLLDGREPPEHVGATLVLARVDGKKCRIEGNFTGWRQAGIPLDHAREVLFNQARCIITDRLHGASGKRTGRHAMMLRWQMGPGWEITREGEDWIARQDGVTVVIKLPAALSWEVVTGQPTPQLAGWVGGRPAPCFIGNGGIESEVELVTSFEVR